MNLLIWFGIIMYISGLLGGITIGALIVLAWHHRRRRRWRVLYALDHLGEPDESDGEAEAKAEFAANLESWLDEAQVPG